MAITAEEVILANLHILAERMTHLHFANKPELHERYGEQGRQRCHEDAVYHLQYLAEALRFERPDLYVNYIHWVGSMLASRHIPIEDIQDNLNYLQASTKELLHADQQALVDLYVGTARSRAKEQNPVPDSFLSENDPLGEEAARYMDLLMRGDRQQAALSINELLDRGIPILDIYEHIFQKTQYEVGRLWQTNKISVAHEHYCTAATQQIMSGLYPIIFSKQRKGRTLVACSVTGDLHEMGIRMVADHFELDGWDTYYLGANMPDMHLIEALRDNKAHLLAISATIPIHLRRVERLIRSVRKEKELDHVRILVGGYLFNTDPGLWQLVGADGHALGARHAVELANGLMKNRP